jgi:hypothetical protein
MLPDICIDCGDTGGKFATGFSDIIAKLAARVNYAGGKAPPVSITLTVIKDYNILLPTH